MTTADHYRIKAAELNAKARLETNSDLRSELEHLAASYLRLAEQADRNNRVDITYETPSMSERQKQQPQQQQSQQQQSQQQQPKPEQEE